MRYPWQRMTIKSPRLVPVPVRPPGQKKEKKIRLPAPNKLCRFYYQSFKVFDRLQPLTKQRL